MENEAPSTVRRRPETRSSASKTRSSAAEAREGGEMEVFKPEADASTGSRDRRRKRLRSGDSPAPRSKKADSASEERDPTEDEVTEDEVEEVDEPVVFKKRAPGKRGVASRGENDEEKDGGSWFVGQPFSRDEARRRWPHRYKISKEEVEVKAKCHYRKALVDNCTYELFDNVYVKAGEGEPHYIGRIVEFFESTDNKLYITLLWYFRAKDTVMKDHGIDHDERRVFISDEKNDNDLDCIVSKVKIVQVAPNIDLKTKKRNIPPCNYYYDMKYDPSYATFANILTGEGASGSEISSSTLSSEENSVNVSKHKLGSCDPREDSSKTTASLLDLYSGCGAMSTGLCLGAQLSGLNLESRWAVDFNEYACESLKLNHPNVEVRNEKAENFLALLKEWEKLCHKFGLIRSDNSSSDERESSVEDQDDDNNDDEEEDASAHGEEFVVSHIIGIRYNDSDGGGKVGLEFKIRWKGYGPSDDTWEPIENLSNCRERITDFVKQGYKSHILPLPGQVDVICGGPPCQGISGFNRFRNYSAPLDDPKNMQMQIFMDIVDHLKPRFVLMENVVDILKFAGGYLGRYAVGRLVSMNYQARLGMMVAGCYGLPQFRMRAFLWGARPTEILPQFPLPTHNVIVRGGIPNEFENCAVAYEEDQPRDLVDALVLKDAISDLPPVQNDETRDEMPYGRPPKTSFQKFIRSTKSEMGGSSNKSQRTPERSKLFDHRPLKLNDDDYQRVCQIPKKKGANFRSLPGVRVREDNTVEWDPRVERVYLDSGKPLVPDYAMSFVKGKSCKPFGRLWWDETVPTVVTRAEPHNQAILHPEQDRVLTIRENARLQGFPDYYKLCGPIKERYIQVGNAVAVPVARALGYALGLSFQGGCGEDKSVLQLPSKFPQLDGSSAVNTSEAENDVVDF